MTTLYRDLMINQGATFSVSVRVLENGSPKDLSGYSGRMQIRDLPADDLGSTILATATVTIDVPTSIVTARLGSDLTVGYTWEQGVYDLEIDGGTVSTVFRVMKGRISTSKEVTR